MSEQQALTSEKIDEQSKPADDIWRNEIHARVAGYRNRKGRRVEGAFSMRFPFPPSEQTNRDTPREMVSDVIAQEVPETVELQETAVAEPMLPPASEADVRENCAPTYQLTSEPREERQADLEEEAASETRLAVPRPRSKRKIIAFPRQATEAPAPVYRLADPVLPEQPRILDVPEELEAFPSTPLLDGLQFSAHPEQVPAPSADHIELPFQAARLSQRVYAGVIDVALVTVGAGLFATVAYKMMPNLVITKSLRLGLAVIPFLLWAAYQYLLMVYSGRTIGMKVAGLSLSTFKGTPPGVRRRRSRVVGLYFATASLLMGVVWALVDVDTLCWHDRISRTYPVRRE